MSVYELTQRTERILKKYEKYDEVITGKKKAKPADAFQEEFQLVENQVDKLELMAKEVAAEKNRALVASKNAEIRKQKADIMNTSVATLTKTIRKGPGRNAVVTKEVLDTRVEQLKALVDRLQSVSDGTTLAAKKPFRPASLSALFDKGKLELDTTTMAATSAEDFQHTKETLAFETEWNESKLKQDEALDRIERGVATLGDMAKNLSEEMDKQAPILNDIDTGMDRVAKNLRNNNEKLKGIVTKMRSSRNFCVDIILICLLLGIGAYIYSLVR